MEGLVVVVCLLSFYKVVYAVAKLGWQCEEWRGGGYGAIDLSVLGARGRVIDAKGRARWNLTYVNGPWMAVDWEGSKMLWMLRRLPKYDARCGGDC